MFTLDEDNSDAWKRHFKVEVEFDDDEQTKFRVFLKSWTEAIMDDYRRQKQQELLDYAKIIYHLVRIVDSESE